MKNMLTNGISQDTRIVWIVWLSFHAQDLQKYHPLGSSTYCENTKISCIPQNFKYITTSDSFIRSQLILVAPCVIRQFCRYCPYSNKPVIWATVACTLRAHHPSTSNQHPSQRCSTNDQRREDNSLSYPEEMSLKTQMESTNTPTQSSPRSGTLGITTPL